MPVASPDDGLGDAPPEQAEETPQPAVRGGKEPAQDDRRRGALGVPRRFAGLAGIVDPADRLVGVRIAGVDAGEVVERRPPGVVLGERADTCLLEAAERLVERGAERPVDGHHLAGRLHLAAEAAIGAGELVEREARQLDDDVVERGFEGGDGRTGHHVRDLGEAPPDGDLRRDPGDRVARGLRGQRRRARDARVDLDDGVLGRVRRERELDVAAALDAERPDDREGRTPEPLMHGVGQRLDGRDDDGIPRVDPERVHVLHRADGDARVVGVAHHLVLDLLPADETLLDHDLADRAGAQAGADAFAIRRLGLDDAAAGAAERECRPDDRRQPDLGERDLDVAGLLDDPRGGVRLLDPVEQVAERLAVLGHPDRLERRAEEPDRVAVEHAGRCHRRRQVEGGLAAEPGQQALGLLLGDDCLDRLDGERLEVDDVGDRRVGHDRRRVRVDQDRPHALRAQGATGLGPGVVEFGRLADDDGAGPEDQDRGRLRAGRGHAATAHSLPDMSGRRFRRGSKASDGGRAVSALVIHARHPSPSLSDSRRSRPTRTRAVSGNDLVMTGGVSWQPRRTGRTPRARRAAPARPPGGTGRSRSACRGGAALRRSRR